MARSLASKLLLLAAASVGLVHCPRPNPPPDDSGCEARRREFFDGGVERGQCPVLACQSDNGMSLTVGTGRDGTTAGFTALRDGDTLYVIPGEQGLQHLLVGFRGRGFDGRLPLIEVRARRASDCVEVGYTRFRLPFETSPEDPSALAINGIRVLLNDDDDRTEYCTILGQDVHLVIEASTPEGAYAHREARVHVGGIDPATRPELRDAWLNACARRDGGADAAIADVTEREGSVSTEDAATDAAVREY